MEKELTLKSLIEGGRDIKNFSQRELARRIGLSNTSLNDLENGKVKKPDIEILRKIAEELDLSLEQLLKAYEPIASMLAGSSIETKPVEEKVFAAMVFNPSLNVAELRLEQFWKT